MMTELDLYESYKDMLNECHDLIQIGNLTYGAGEVLEAVDPVAFRVGMDEYADSLMEDGEEIEGR